MKRLFTFSLVVLLFTLSLRAQTISIDPASFQLHFSATDQEATHSTVYNNSGVTRTLRWVRIIGESNPAQWTSTVCDLNNCYASGTSTMDFVLNGNSNGLMDVTVTPHDIAGVGSYTIYVYDIDDSANVNATLNIDVVAEGTTGIIDPVDGDVSIYPIPAKDVLNVGFTVAENVNRVEVYNVVGQKLKSVNIASGLKGVAVPVSDLKKGVYFVRVYSNGKELITKTFTKE
jgi:hypothetical protein